MEQTIEVDMSKYKFCVGMPVNRDLPIQTTLSLLYTFRKFDQEKCPLALAIEANNSIVDSARNKVVQTFLKTDADVLFFIDSDISWRVEDFIKVAALSVHYGIVGAAYSTKNDEDPKMFVNAIKDENDNFVTNEIGLVEMYGCGFGFIAIPRKVFEQLMPITEKYKDGNDEEIYRFFKIDTQEGYLVGEDIYFLKKWVKELGNKAYLVPDIRLGHIGQKIYAGALADTDVYKQKIKQEDL